MFTDLRHLLTSFGLLRRAPQKAPIEPFERWHDYGPVIGVQILRPVVYTMEQNILPQAFFQGHPSIARATAGTTRISKELTDLWLFSFRHCVEAGSVPRDHDSSSLPVLRYLSELGACTTVSRHQQDSVAASVVSLPPPLGPGEAFFMALCTTVTGSQTNSRCFSLEKSLEAGVAYVCELLPNGSRANLGPTPILSRDGFATQSMARLSAVGA